MKTCTYIFHNKEKCKEETCQSSNFCILHIDLPEDEASEEFKEINDLKKKKVAEKVSKEDFNFEGARLLEVNLSRKKITKTQIRPIDDVMTFMEIESTLNFTNAVIRRDALFNDAEINGIASFDGAKIGGNASFAGVKIKGDASFDEADIGGYAEFNIAEISGAARFDEANVGGYVWFVGAKIIGFALFDGAEIGEYAKFNEARIGGIASFAGAKIAEDASFDEATIGGNASFRNATIGGIVSLAGANISGIALFEGANIGKDVSLVKTKIVGDALFPKAKIVGDVAFQEAEIGRDVSFDGAEIGGRTIRFDRTEIKGTLSFKDTTFKNSKAQEEACREAKNIWAKKGNREEEDYYYYREMEAKRKQKGRFIRFLELIFIKLPFEYGTNWKRVFLTWIFVVVGFALYSYIVNGVEGANSLLENFYFSVVTVTTLGYGDYYPKQGTYQLVVSLVAIFGTFMWAAFIVIFARKYMR